MKLWNRIFLTFRMENKHFFQFKTFTLHLLSKYNFFKASSSKNENLSFNLNFLSLCLNKSYLSFPLRPFTDSIHRSLENSVHRFTVQ